MFNSNNTHIYLYVQFAFIFLLFFTINFIGYRVEKKLVNKVLFLQLFFNIILFFKITNYLIFMNIYENILTLFEKIKNIF